MPNYKKVSFPQNYSSEKKAANFIKSFKLKSVQLSLFNILLLFSFKVYFLYFERDRQSMGGAERIERIPSTFCTGCMEPKWGSNLRSVRL